MAGWLIVSLFCFTQLTAAIEMLLKNDKELEYLNSYYKL
jgi:hypothetical protein